MMKISRESLHETMEKEADADFGFYQSLYKLASLNPVLRGEINVCLDNEARRLETWFYHHFRVASSQFCPGMVKDLAVQNGCRDSRWGFLFL